MKRFTRVVLFCVFAFCVTAQAQTDYVITDFPITAKASTDTIWIKWAGTARTNYLLLGVVPDSAVIRYGNSPGSTKMAAYPSVIVPDTGRNNVWFDQLSPKQRGIRFTPGRQTGMGVGVFYYRIFFPTINNGVRDTFVSNELQMIVESPSAPVTKGPDGTITSITPTFSWDANPGVPYYHVILSDQEIAISQGGDGATQGVAGLSIVWQAITPNSQIVYGAPDPSGTITAAPPPLSPGSKYSWVVLNNYLNVPASTSTKFGLPKTFIIQGDTMKAPRNVTPVQDTINSTDNNGTITFKWTNLDTAANTYKIYVYITSKMDQVKAQLVVWETEVTARNFVNDTGYATIDARSTLTENHYTWKVIAVDSKGAGRGGDTTSFDFQSPTGKLQVETKENIVSGAYTIVSPVALVQIKIEVLDGSMEAPLLFYTDNNGYLNRDRPVGTYRITTIKNGFNDQVQTVSVTNGNITPIVIYLERPQASIHGKVVDGSAIGVNLAELVAVSDRSDTIKIATDASGNYVLNSYEADWTIFAKKTGFITSLPVRIRVDYGASVTMSTIALQVNPYSISGTVKNSAGQLLTGVNVSLYRSNILQDVVPSTSENGTYSFAVTAGTYSLVASKTGFTSYNKTIEVTRSVTATVTMSAGAALVTGYIIGRTHNDTVAIYAPITNAPIRFVKTGVQGGDTVSLAASATYGDYRASIEGGFKYTMLSSANGFIGSSRIMPDTIRAGMTWPTAFNDTLKGYGSLSGYCRSSTTMAGLGGVLITLFDPATNLAVLSATSQANGYFELRNIPPDDTLYLRAARDGMSMDAAVPSDTLFVRNGRVYIQGQNHSRNLVVNLSAGTKTIKWNINNGADLTSTIKVTSPIQKMLGARDSLTNAGWGAYTVSIDPVADSIIPLLTHQFTVDEVDVGYIDSVKLMARHTTFDDTLRIASDSLSITLRSTDTLNGAVLYYRDNTEALYCSTAVRIDAVVYNFRIKPRRDGSNMVYYFRATYGSDVFGNPTRPFTRYVAPNPKLSKLEIVPSSTDTLNYPSDYTLSFKFQGYYGSNFIIDTTDYSSSLTWSLVDAAGCTPTSGTGRTFTVKTGTSATTTPVKVVVTIANPSAIVLNTVAPSCTTLFNVSGAKLDSIVIERVDAQNPNPIKSTARAEFTAMGYDVNGNSVTVNPTWAIDPASAGTISNLGVFSPIRRFAGSVRVTAAVGSVSGEYNPNAANLLDAGIKVQHSITRQSTKDTASNNGGCLVVFPPNVVSEGAFGLLDITIPKLTNLVQRGIGGISIVGSAYQITELQSVALQFGTDSVAITLDIPDAARSKALSVEKQLYVARWSEDSLRWDTLPNTRIAADGRSATVNTRHFSLYAIVTLAGELAGSIEVSPNPFSPYVIAPAARFGAGAIAGTRIRFNVDGPDDQFEVKVQIVSITGERVWAVRFQNAKRGVQYDLWWNGKTAPVEVNWGGSEIIGGDKMCHNGRYFVIMMVKGIAKKELKYMRPIILIK